MGSLAHVLQDNRDAASRLVVVDAVFSMDGDIANLPEIVNLCERYNARLMVDEAHSLGVLGATGRGIQEHFGVNKGIDIHMGTLSKAIPSIGGYIAGEADLINYLRHNSRPYIFSGALPPSCAAAASCAFDLIESEPERVERLNKNTILFLEQLRDRNFNLLNSTTPILPVVTGSEESALKMSSRCLEKGLFVMPVISPAVPANLSRLRVLANASHSVEDIQRVVQILTTAAQEIGSTPD